MQDSNLASSSQSPKMALPEIADVASKFAVMVRLQGPDPKGLKMRNHAFHHYNSGRTTISASGVLLPGFLKDSPMSRQILCINDVQSLSDSVLVVTVASVIEPFLSAQTKENISEAKPELIPGAQIDIMFERKAESDALDWLPARLLKLVDIPVSATAVQLLFEALPGTLELGWEVGWSLASQNNGPQAFLDAIGTEVEQPSMQDQKEMLTRESGSSMPMGKSITRIALLAVYSKFLKHLPGPGVSTHDKKGDLLLAMGSPFGILSPMHFFNSISVGSIANCYPPGSCRRSLLMADIRCLPGMEGAPVFGENAHLIGILTRPLRQRLSTAEVQLVIPWEAIATACSALLQDEPQNASTVSLYTHGKLNDEGMTCLSESVDSFNHIHEHPNFAGHLPSPVKKAMTSICLVTMDNGTWASGVLLNKQGLILTNAHLFEPWRFGKAAASGASSGRKSDAIFIPFYESVHDMHEPVLQSGPKSNLYLIDNPRDYKANFMNAGCRKIRVRFDNIDHSIWCDAKVLYISRGPLDVALLLLEYVPNQLNPIVMDLTNPSPGSKAYVIGHGLFGPRTGLSPSVCVGVVAKVVKAERPPLNLLSKPENGGHFPAMIETTAAVHPGGSGGAVVSANGHMIGLVTSNAKHGGGTIIPHLNFSIPCAALDPIFKYSRDMGDSSPLEALNKPNEHLSSVWALMPSLSAKQEPSLPSLPSLPPGENDKDVKGSRFAKFLAERDELFKKTTQLGKEKTLSPKFISSKL